MRTAIILLIAALSQIRGSVSIHCWDDEEGENKTGLECGIRLNKGCEITRHVIHEDKEQHGDKCMDYEGYVDCHCANDICNRNKWSLKRQFGIFFEDYFKSTGNVHQLSICHKPEVYSIGHLYPHFAVKICSIRITLGQHDVCLSTQQCFENTRLALPDPSCSLEKAVVSCYCQDYVEKKECTETRQFLEMLINYNPSIEKRNLQSCMHDLQNKWNDSKVIPKTDQSYECIGNHKGGWSGLKVCALLLRKKVDGSCELEQQSRSVPGNVAPGCDTEGYDAICYCLGNNCNAYETKFKFPEYFEKANHIARSCLKMISHRVMSDHGTKKIGPHSYECAGDDNDFWKAGNTICGLMISAEGEACVLKQISRAVAVSGTQVPDCQEEDGSLFCFCIGDNCNQDYQLVFGQFDAFFTQHSNHAIKNCYEKVIEPTTFSTPSTPEQLTSTIETTVDTTTTNGRPTASKPGYGTSGSDSRSTTRKDISTGTHTNDEQTNKEEDSSVYFGLFIGAAAFNVLTVATILALIVALIKMKKRGEAKQATVKIEKAPKAPTAITIEKPAESKESPGVPTPSAAKAVVSKVSSTAPVPASNTNQEANQREEAADKTTTGTGPSDLDYTGGSTDSDSTGPQGFSEVNWRVSGFNRN